MLNEVNLIGRLGKDPEVKQGQKVLAARFTMAVGPKDHVEWVNVVAYDKLAKIVEDFLQKGTLLYVKGQMQTVKYQDQKTKEDKYFTQVVCSQIKFLSDTKAKQQNQNQGPADFAPPNF